MTPRQNVLSALNRRGFEWVPVDFTFCPSQVEAFERRFGHADYCTYFNLCHRSVAICLQKNIYDIKVLYRREELPAQVDIDEWGVGHSKGSAAAMHMTRMHHPLRGSVDVSEVESYPFPSIPQQEPMRLEAEIAALHERGLAAFASMQCTVWEKAWYIRSMEDLMLDMMMGDEKAAVLLDRVTAVSVAMAQTFARAGADILSLGDDVGGQNGPLMSIDIWKQWIKPRLAKVIGAARAVKPDILIFYHSCGAVEPFIEQLIEIGVDILNPVQPECMSFDVVHGAFGDRLSFWGTVGTQSTLPFGTPEEVRRVTRLRLERCGKKGGIVIGPTHLVEPEVPWENIVALYETARDFRP